MINPSRFKWKISRRSQPPQLTKPESSGKQPWCYSPCFLSAAKCGSWLHRSHFRGHLRWPSWLLARYQDPWDDTVLVYRHQKSTLGLRQDRWIGADTSLAYNQPDWLFHHSRGYSQPVRRKNDSEGSENEVRPRNNGFTHQLGSHVLVLLTSKCFRPFSFRHLKNLRTFSQHISNVLCQYFQELSVMISESISHY